ncbi:APC family permease [Paraburkholderia caballeronis]|uniref:APC family permease n=1 Tax=Paraburkholderia caballeronis TaxID=416943 RepID=UPI001066CABC|nr:APC family permease [Paraburkholderia caballeronis]TDV06762.1 amino acid/polyamine/organocation transporter (APC superfamily) [Paraburkholderia caballeronis]TDV09942.1 amino acid/polyamine/organocation transporter (APC superfamily) [Paraburkholderia caballeronis]TDV21774.1 amino acid/polyamine/organocation transporter (APC superfamily) [Paraburkholderia caballeronis]
MTYESSNASALAAPADAPHTGGLRRNYLNLPELIAQSIGLVGVSGGIGVLIPAVFATAGNGTWLAYVFAIVALLFSSWSISIFARDSASPGALYSYVSAGIGPLWGAICGWSLLIAYALAAAGILQGTLSTFLVLGREVGLLGGTVSTSVTLGLTVATAFAAWYIAFRDIRLSTRFTLLVELATLLLIAIVVIGTIAFGGHPVDRAQIALDGVKPTQLQLGMVLAFFSFTGFESATVLGAEAKDPFRAIPRAVVISVVGPAVFFVIGAYGLVSAFEGQTPALDHVDGPLAVLAHRLGAGWVGVLIDAGVSLSFFAAFFSSINAAARIVYTFGRQGLLHELTGRAHETNATPHVAVALVALLSLVTALVFTAHGTALLDSYGYLSSIATYGWLLAYVLVAIGAPLYLRRQGRLKAAHVAVSVVAVALLAIPLIGSVYPAPDGVYARLPYVFLALLAVGLAWFVVLRARAPERLRELEEDLLTK